MARYLLLTVLAAGITISSGAAAQPAGQDRFSGPLRSTTRDAARDPTQMSIDVSQYSPEAQMAKILRNTEMLVQQNRQLAQELAAMQQRQQEMEARLRSLSTVLTTGSGESIGSMVRKIKDKVVGPY